MITPIPRFDITGGWVKAPFLPDKIRQELMLHLGQAGLTDDQVERFLDECNHAARIENGERQRIGLDVEREQLYAIASNARRLLSSLRNAHSQTLTTLGIAVEWKAQEYFPEIHYSLPVPDENGSVSNPFAKIWGPLTLLELAVNHAIGDLQPSRQTKPAQVNGLRLTIQVAEAFRRQTGKLPPLNSASWFAGFMECLGNHLQMQCGPRIVAAGIRAVESQHVDR